MHISVDEQSKQSLIIEEQDVQIFTTEEMPSIVYDNPMQFSEQDL